MKWKGAFAFREKQIEKPSSAVLALPADNRYLGGGWRQLNIHHTGITGYFPLTSRPRLECHTPSALLIHAVTDIICGQGVAAIRMAAVSTAHYGLLHVLLLEGGIVVTLGAQRLGLATIDMIYNQLKIVNGTRKLRIWLDGPSLGK